MREALQVLLVREVEGEGVGGIQHVLAVFELQQGEFLFQPGVSLLVFGPEQRAAAHEALVALLQELALVGRQVQRAPAVIDGLDAREQRLVERDIHVEIGQQGRDLLGDLLHPVVALGFEQVEKDAADAVQGGAREFEGLDGVGEGRRLRVGGDGVHLGLAGLDGRPEGRQIVLLADQVEARSPEREGGRNQ